MEWTGKDDIIRCAEDRIAFRKNKQSVKLHKIINYVKVWLIFVGESKKSYYEQILNNSKIREQCEAACYHEEVLAGKELSGSLFSFVAK